MTMTDIQDMIHTPELARLGHPRLLFSQTVPAFPEILYVAGPMSGLPELNYPAFFAAAARLEAAGFRVENPAITQYGPEAHYTDYIRAGAVQLFRSHAVAVLEDWWKSGGARWEITTAGLLHLPVRTVDEWIALKEAA